jgi:hypothetical protein
MDVNRIFTPEQIQVPPELPGMLKEFTKAVIRKNPKSKEDIAAFAVEYFKLQCGEKMFVSLPPNRLLLTRTTLSSCTATEQAFIPDRPETEEQPEAEAEEEPIADVEGAQEIE